MKTPPLSRHEALRPLSREHFGGLVLARALSRAARAPAGERAEAVERLRQAWSEELAPHFRDEERLLLPVIPAAADRARLLVEHRQLRVLVELVLGASEPGPELLATLGERLHDHIRWEERALFPAVEGAATTADWGRISLAAGEIEAQRPGSRAWKPAGGGAAPPLADTASA